MDEKKIEEAAEDIFEDKFLGNGEEIIFTNDEGCEDYREEMYHDGQIKEAISLDAHWAIQEFLKSLWHDASEEPRKEATILIETKCKFYYVWKEWQNNFYPFWDDAVACSNITRWLYIDDLFPKQKGGE